MGHLDVGHNDIEKIARFFTLVPHHVVAVIGCGYGREAAHICKRVALVYGIDVNEGILSGAGKYLRDAKNFRPVLAENHDAEIPPPVDLVYSVTVMQHITRDLVHNYLGTMAPKLSTEGRMIIQFLESSHGEEDALIELYEPTVSWSRDQISMAVEGAGLRVLEIKTDVISPGVAWHWAYVGK